MSLLRKLFTLLYDYIILPIFNYIHHHRSTLFVVLSILCCLLCYISYRASGLLCIFYALSTGWQRYFQKTSRRMAWDLRIFALLTNFALALPLLVLDGYTRSYSRNLHGLIFMSGSGQFLVITIFVGFYNTKLKPWLITLYNIHNKYVNIVHGNLEAGNIALYRIYVQLIILFIITILVGLDYHPLWLITYRSLLLRILCSISLFCGLWIQIYPQIPYILKSISVTLACNTIYILLVNSWEGLVLIVLPLTILSETLPSQLQNLLDMLQALPIQQTSLPMSQQIQPQTTQQTTNILLSPAQQQNSTTLSPRNISNNTIINNDSNSVLSPSSHNTTILLPTTTMTTTNTSPRIVPKMSRFISQSHDDYTDFLFMNLISFRQLENILRYIMLFHLGLFMPRQSSITLQSYNHNNILDSSSPVFLQYIGLILYITLPIIQLVDMRYQLRCWYDKMHDYQWS